MRHRSLTRDGAAPYILLAPLLLLLVAFILYPVVMNLVASFTDWKGYGAQKWVGWANYAAMAKDPSFWTSIGNTLVLIVYIPIGTVVTLLIAAFLREGIRGWSWYRAILYIPNLLGYVIMGVIFSIYLRDDGALNLLVKSVTGSPLHFLIDPFLALNTIGFGLVVWLHLGFGLIYFLAAMSGIDKTIYEAALVDGRDSGEPSPR